MPQQPDDDLDAWYADHVRPYRLKLLERTWDLPGAIPAVKVLLYQRFIGQAWDPGRDPAAELQIPEEFAEAVTETGDLSWRWIIADLVDQAQLDAWDEAGLTQPHEQRVAAALLDRYVLRNGAMTAFIDAAYGAALDAGDIVEEADEGGKARAATSTPKKRGGGSSPAGRRSKPAGKPSTARTSASSSSTAAAPGAGSQSA